MKKLSETIGSPAAPRSALRGAARGAIAASMLLAATLSLGAQDAAAAASSDDELFGEPETVSQAATTSQEAEGKSAFLKYDQVKVGGSFKGSAAFNAAYSDPWGGSLDLLDPAKRYISPAIEGKVTIVAKPTTDFGVNMDFRTSWPFSTTDSLATSATSMLGVTTVTGTESVTIPNISVWSLYSKFNWNDRVYFSFGKQPLAWGVSKGYFQPADDIFAVSTTIDPTDTTAEREGPISLKTTVPLGVTNNLYFYAGLPTSSDGSTAVDPADARLAVKGEYGFGNTELALAGYYAYNDHPRAILMGTTSLGSWNVYGEAVLKYGSERYFLTSATSGEKKADQLWFTGTLGGYYSDSDAGLTVLVQYMYNGEGQTGVSAQDAYTYYALNSSKLDRMKLGTHYGFASISETNLFPTLFGKDKLGATLIAMANLSDLSGMVMPSLSYTFFDYMILKVGATFNFGEAGDEYILYGVGQGLGSSTPGMALTASLTIGTGSF